MRVFIACAALVLAGCSGLDAPIDTPSGGLAARLDSPPPIAESPTAQASPSPTKAMSASPSATSGDWWASLPMNGPFLKTVIDEDAANGNCEGLQETFDIWANADHFDGQAELLAYIDTALAAAACYGE